MPAIDEHSSDKVDSRCCHLNALPDLLPCKARCTILKLCFNPYYLLSQHLSLVMPFPIAVVKRNPFAIASFNPSVPTTEHYVLLSSHACLPSPSQISLCHAICQIAAVLPQHSLFLSPAITAAPLMKTLTLLWMWHEDSHSFVLTSRWQKT